jgi:hypothetical protein
MLNFHDNVLQDHLTAVTMVLRQINSDPYVTTLHSVMSTFTFVFHHILRIEIMYQ